MHNYTIYLNTERVLTNWEILACLSLAHLAQFAILFSSHCFFSSGSPLIEEHMVALVLLNFLGAVIEFLAIRL